MVSRVLLISGTLAALAIIPFAALSARAFRLGVTPARAAQSQSPATRVSSPSSAQIPPAASAQSLTALPQSATPSPVHEVLPVVIVDPGHGGADAGARGPSGVQEKELTLALAEALRAECEREGFHVILTREGDQDPSFDDRAAVANAHRYAIFISLHVASTGPPGTVRTYVYPATAGAQDNATNGPGTSNALGGMNGVGSATSASGHGLLVWERAQQPSVANSRKLGDLIQVELSQRFSQSPELSVAVPVRDLRSIAAPAVAVEISSVDVADAQSVRRMIPVVASAIARGVSGFGQFAGSAKP